MRVISQEEIDNFNRIVEQQQKDNANKKYFNITYMCPLDHIHKVMSVHAKSAEEAIPIHKEWLDAWVIKETEKRRLQEIAIKEYEIRRAEQDKIQAKIDAEQEVIHMQFAKTSTYCNGCRHFDEESYSSDDECGKYRGCTFIQKEFPGDDAGYIDGEDKGFPCERPDDCPTRMKE